ncbi:uncharacterized protein G2W53_033860 [Senna tora]|uniref:Uncharacterized protein n=1 Tax=Senna tora TaxID=362788 RepID=A0A834WD97_9FABA|nr:uncharacterized protein G2W53_033860 [Senna tora]
MEGNKLKERLNGNKANIQPRGEERSKISRRKLKKKCKRAHSPLSIKLRGKETREVEREEERRIVLRDYALSGGLCRRLGGEAERRRSLQPLRRTPHPPSSPSSVVRVISMSSNLLRFTFVRISLASSHLSTASNISSS